jgi:hypothetical protein
MKKPRTSEVAGRMATPKGQLSLLARERRSEACCMLRRADWHLLHLVPLGSIDALYLAGEGNSRIDVNEM